MTWAPSATATGRPTPTRSSGGCADASWLVDGVLEDLARDLGDVDADGLVSAVRDACATIGCAVGDAWQALAVARSVARAFGVLNPQVLYDALLTGAEVGCMPWDSLL